MRRPAGYRATRERGWDKMADGSVGSFYTMEYESRAHPPPLVTPPMLQSPDLPCASTRSGPTSAPGPALRMCRLQSVSTRPNLSAAMTLPHQAKPNSLRCRYCPELTLATGGNSNYFESCANFIGSMHHWARGQPCTAPSAPLCSAYGHLFLLWATRCLGRSPRHANRRISSAQKGTIHT